MAKMKQTIQKSRNKRGLAGQPDWWDAYLHLKFKVFEEPVAGYQSLGIMTIDEIGKKILRNMYATNHVEQAVIELVKQGVMNLCYVFEEDQTFIEDFECPAEDRTLNKLKDGRLFNRLTGHTFDLSAVERRFCLAPQTLAKMDESEGKPTILQSIRNWFRHE